jgi:hypothetical protein
MSQPQAATPTPGNAAKSNFGLPRAEFPGKAREGGIIYPFILLFVILAIWKGSTFYGQTNLLEILDQQSATQWRRGLFGSGCHCGRLSGSGASTVGYRARRRVRRFRQGPGRLAVMCWLPPRFPGGTPAAASRAAWRAVLCGPRLTGIRWPARTPAADPSQEETSGTDNDDGRQADGQEHGDADGPQAGAGAGSGSPFRVRLGRAVFAWSAASRRSQILAVSASRRAACSGAPEPSCCTPASWARYASVAWSPPVREAARPWARTSPHAPVSRRRPARRRLPGRGGPP